MSPRTKPPFRGDHVGSLLRPKELLQARDDQKQDRISSAELRRIEDDAIRKVVRMQEDTGLQGATDGELLAALPHGFSVPDLAASQKAADSN